MNELMKDKIVLVTGGGTGLGFGIARSLVDAGARVVICGRRESVLQKAVAELGEQAFYEVYDVADTAAAGDLFTRIESRIGGVTTLINNAGIHIKKPAEELSDEEFLKVLQIHLVGAQALCRELYPGLCRRGGGSILFIASMASYFGIPYVAAYSAAKSAILGLVRTLAVEWGKDNIRINAVAPGWIDSPMMRAAVDSDPERKKKILGRTPLGRFGEAEDIGQAVLYLSSPAAKFITGTCLAVDGGAAIGF